jgi:hypothetical protein
MYSKNVRVLMHEEGKTVALDEDVKKILRLAMDAPPSRGPVELGSENMSGKCSVPPDRTCR